MPSRFAPQPDPPYYSVIFANQRSAPAQAEDGYAEMAARMSTLAAQQKGYIGHDSARDPDGFGITVSYWMDEAAVLNWKAVAEHTLAQKLGKERWYEYYTLRVAIVERQYDGPRGR